MVNYRTLAILAGILVLVFAMNPGLLDSLKKQVGLVPVKMVECDVIVTNPLPVPEHPEGDPYINVAGTTCRTYPVSRCLSLFSIWNPIYDDVNVYVSADKVSKGYSGKVYEVGLYKTFNTVLCVNQGTDRIFVELYDEFGKEGGGQQLDIVEINV